MPGSVVATKRTPDSAGSAITRSNERAALAPPGRSRTDRSASGGPAINSSQGSLMAASVTIGPWLLLLQGRARRSPLEGLNHDEAVTPCGRIALADETRDVSPPRPTSFQTCLSLPRGGVRGLRVSGREPLG